MSGRCTPFRDRFARVAVVACLAVCVASVPAEAKPDYLRRYQAGLKAIEREDWARASDLMQKAVMERPNEAGKLSQWFYWDPYLPNFYYGLAQYHLGRCAQAMRSFNASEEQGVLLAEDELYATMIRLRDECQARGAKAATAGPGGEREKRVRIADLAASGDRILGAAEPLAESPEAQRRLRQTRAGLDVARVTDEEAERIGELADAGPPPALDRAIVAYFGGDSGQALAALDGVVDDDPRVEAHLQLLRAAAAYRLYLLSAETEAAWLERARSAARGFKRSEASVAVPRSLFGPRFLDFLGSVSP
ncbi:MAG: hypothetical protein AAGC60_01560 [Acidobacteriota bacterium]